MPPVPTSTASQPAAEHSSTEQLLTWLGPGSVVSGQWSGLGLGFGFGLGLGRGCGHSLIKQLLTKG